MGSLARMRVGCMIAAATTFGLVSTPAHAAHGATTGVTVRGGYVDDVACLVPTDPAGDYNPDPATPTMLTYQCVGSNTWDGSWVGQNVYTAVGTVDLLTGNTSGSSDQTFRGVYTGDETPLPGTLHFHATYVIDGRTGAVHVDERILGGEDAFAGSAGCFVADGFEADGTFGNGGYSGTWFRGGADRQTIEAACPSA